MADRVITTESNNGLYFLVGVLLVAVVVLGFLYFNGTIGGGSASSNPVANAVESTADAVPDVNVNVNKDSQ